MNRGQQFSFIIERNIVKRIERVITVNYGRIACKEERDKDVVYTVERI